MVSKNTKPFLIFGGLVAGLAGYMYLKNTQKVNKIDLGAGSGSNGIGGSGEFYNTPGVDSVDSVATGIEDNVPSVGVVDASDSGSTITQNDVVDNLDEPLLSSSDIASLVPYVGLAGSGYVANRILKSTAVRSSASGAGLLSKVTRGGLRVAGGLSRAIPVVGTGLLAGDVYDINEMLPNAGGADLYSLIGLGTVATAGPAGILLAPSAISGARQFGQTMSGLNHAIGDTIANAVTPSADVKNNVGNLTLISPENARKQNSLNYIAGTPGDTWKRTYYAEKTGASASKGLTTSTYQSSSGAQVALAGISPSEYASYLKSKGK